MEIIRLPPGERASDEADCISIVRRDDGLYELKASALIACGDGDEVESVSLIGLPPFATWAEAENAGTAWAADQCVERLYVSDVEFSVLR